MTLTGVMEIFSTNVVLGIVNLAVCCRVW